MSYDRDPPQTDVREISPGKEEHGRTSGTCMSKHCNTVPSGTQVVLLCTALVSLDICVRMLSIDYDHASRSLASGARNPWSVTKQHPLVTSVFIVVVASGLNATVISSHGDP